MWVRKTVVLATATIACTTAMSIAWPDGRTLSASEMAQLRGGNSNQMQCSATCNHLNGFDTPCAGKQQGNGCIICTGTNYNYITQVTNPPPTNCNVTTAGFQNDPNNGQQGCGFQTVNSTCKQQGTGLVCQGGKAGGTPCNGAVVVQAQPSGQ